MRSRSAVINVSLWSKITETLAFCGFWFANVGTVNIGMVGVVAVFKLIIIISSARYLHAWARHEPKGE
jgi:hypothetical protein